MIRLILFFSFISFFTFGQDTIVFKNGLKQCVKVAEVGMLELKYKRCDNLQGPDYFLDKSEIGSIKYSNGLVEKFGLTVEAITKGVTHVLTMKGK